MWDDHDRVRLLLSHGAQAQESGKYGLPLWHAKSLEVAKLLVEHNGHEAPNAKENLFHYLMITKNNDPKLITYFKELDFSPLDRSDQYPPILFTIAAGQVETQSESMKKLKLCLDGLSPKETEEFITTKKVDKNKFGRPIKETGIFEDIEEKLTHGINTKELTELRDYLQEKLDWAREETAKA